MNAQENLVFIHQNRVMTDSLRLAEAFGRLHKNVLRTIEAELAETPEEVAGLNFELSGYQDDTGRLLPKYNLTRNAFIAIAVGFTGKKARRFKWTIIQRFTEMEEELARLGRPQNNSIDTLLARAEAAEKEAVTYKKIAMTSAGRLSASVRQYKALDGEFSNVKHQLYDANLIIADFQRKLPRWTVASLRAAHPELGDMHPNTLSAKLKRVAERLNLPVEAKPIIVTTKYGTEVGSTVNTFCQMTVDGFLAEVQLVDYKRQ